MSQKELAIELGIPISTLNGYINNRREPDCRTLVQIANYFHVSVDHLLQNPFPIKGEPVELSNHDLEFLKLYQKLNPQNKELIDLQLKLMNSHQEQ